MRPVVVVMIVASLAAAAPLTAVAAIAAAAQSKAAVPPKKSPPAPNRDPSANLPLAERIRLQLDLAWSGSYNGLINGEPGERVVAAIKAFQKEHGFKETGTLAPAERTLLSDTAKAKQQQVGWRVIDDQATGAQVGLPGAHVPNTSAGRTGTRWSSGQGQIQIETFRVRDPGTTLAAVYERQKNEPAGRKLTVNFQRGDMFILSGLQGLKKFYVRAEFKDGEVRGLTILYDQAWEGVMDAATVVMSSTFAPFPGRGLAALIGPPPRRKIEYGTGIVVSTAGHIVTDRALTEGCNVLEVVGRGAAEPVADDPASGLALLRLYGATDLIPAALGPDGARAGELMLAGIADPALQNGRHTVSMMAARLAGDSLQPPPPAGFAGAAALDPQGRVSGLVQIKPAVVASTGANAPAPAQLAPLAAVSKFLSAQGVTPTGGRAGAEAARAALVRVICIRR
jgi:peptidoglycan hydrolase-like protein with peptidoglycan-binding domain